MRKKDRHREKEPTPQPAPEQEAPPEPADATGAAAQQPTEGPVEAPGDVVAALTRERDDLLERLQRVSADYLNYQKRVQREAAQAREFASEQLVKALLPVLDDMERALGAARSNHEEGDPFLTGMQLVHDKAMETLGRVGLTAIQAEGKPFDPELHSAMMQQPTDEHPPQTVLTEVVRGYRLKGRTLRPSGVVVATAPSQEAPGAEADEPPAPDEPPERESPQPGGDGGD